MGGLGQRGRTDPKHFLNGFANEPELLRQGPVSRTRRQRRAPHDFPYYCRVPNTFPAGIQSLQEESLCKLRNLPTTPR